MMQQRPHPRPPRPVPQFVRTLGLALLLAALVVPSASGHAFLEASTPPVNGALPEGAGVAALRFTELFDPDHTTAVLRDGDGAVLPTHTTFPSQRPYEVRVVVDPLPAGDYALEWSVLGVDGHTASGELRFSVGDTVVAEPVEPRAYDPEEVDAHLVGLESVGRALWMLGLLVVLGVPVFVTEVAQERHPPRRVAVVVAAAGGVALVGGSVVMLALARTLGGPLWVAVTSAPGLFLVGKMALVGIATALALGATRAAPNRRAWALASVLPAFLATVMHSMGGHGLLATDSGEGVAGHVGMTLHLVVAGIWVGGMAGFLTLLPDLDRSAAAAVIRRFSPLALASVVVVAATGLYQAVIHFPPGAQGDLYLALILAKVGLLGALVLFGAWHMFWLRPRLERGRAGPRHLGRSLPAESLFMLAVIVVAGVLAAVPGPAAVPGGQGPLAIEESEGRLGEYMARVAVFGNPVRVDEPHDLVIDLEARTSRGVELADLDATLVSPDGQRIPVDALRTDAPGRWTASAAFPDPGTWNIEVSLHEPSQDVRTFPVRVLASQTG